MECPEREQLTCKVNPETGTAKILPYSFLLERAKSGAGGGEKKKSEPAKVRFKKGRLPVHCNRKGNVGTHWGTLEVSVM